MCAEIVQLQCEKITWSKNFPHGKFLFGGVGKVVEMMKAKLERENTIEDVSGWSSGWGGYREG